MDKIFNLFGSIKRNLRLKKIDLNFPKVEFPEEIKKENKEKKVLFLVPFGDWLFHHQVDAVVASALRLRGTDVCIVRCDGIYKDCSIITKGYLLGSFYITLMENVYRVFRDKDYRLKEFCKKCSAVGDHFFSKFKLPFIQMSHYLKNEDYQEAYKWVNSLKDTDYYEAVYDGLQLGRWVTSSVYTFLRISSRGLNRADAREVHKQYLINGFLTYKALSRIYDEYKPTNTVIFNARIYPYRIAFELARMNNIPVVVHERGLTDDTFLLYENNTCISPEPILNIADVWKDIALSKETLVKVKQYLYDLENGIEYTSRYFFIRSNDYLYARKKLNIPADKKLLGLFTSSEFELDDAHTPFCQLDLIDKLIEIFKERDDYLVIRHHPHIGGFLKHKRFSTDSEFLSRVYQQAVNAPDNVKIIMPYEKLSSYSLYYHLDACISLYSSVAYQTPARGIPTAVLSGSPYEHAVYRVINNDNKEYLNNIIDELFRHNKDFDTKDLIKCYRAVNSYISKVSRRFLSFNIKNDYSHNLKFNNINQLLEGHDPALDELCNHILYNMPLNKLPAEDDCNPVEEETFFKNELHELNKYKKSIRDRALDIQETEPEVAIIHLTYSNMPDNNLCSKALRRLRYKKYKIYNCAIMDWNSYRKVFDKISSLLDEIKEEYVSIFSDFIYYDEAFLNSAMESLLHNPENTYTLKSFTVIIENFLLNLINCNDRNYLLNNFNQILIDFQKTILNYSKLKYKGVISGAWILNEQNNISNEIFTKCFYPETFYKACNILPLLKYPQNILSFCLFSKGLLGNIVKNVINISDPYMAGEKIFMFINNNLYKMYLPFLLIPYQVRADKK